MSDFRELLYQHYVSKFKTRHSTTSEIDLRGYWILCKYLYLPFVEELDRRESILDLGCGPGYMMEFLKKQGFSNVEGVDISAEQVEVALRRGLDVKMADAFEFLHSKENVYGAVIVLDFVEHFTKDELIKLFPAIYRALKDDGVMLIQTPNGSGLFPNQVIYDDLTHITIFTPISLRQLLALAGFGDFHFRETGPIPINYKARIIVVLWQFVKVLLNTIRFIEAGKRQDIWTETFICFCRKLGQ